MSSLLEAAMPLDEPIPIEFDDRSTPMIPDIAETGAYVAAAKGPFRPSCN